jgi:hyperosmotically inducible periplasmic protein
VQPHRHGEPQRRIAVEKLVFLMLVMFLSGCMTAAHVVYDVATDERPVGRQADDLEIWGTVKNDIMESGMEGTGDISVFCRNGIVVLAGVVAHGSKTGKEAVKIARGAPGVRKVETYFFPSQPSPLNDFAIKEKIHFKMVEDPELKADQIDMEVIDGHVVLVGVVNSRAKVKRIIAIAHDTTGVRAVKSFIQIQRR